MTAWKFQNVEGWTHVRMKPETGGHDFKPPGKLELLELVQGGAPWAPKKKWPFHSISTEKNMFHP